LLETFGRTGENEKQTAGVDGGGVEDDADGVGLVGVVPVVLPLHAPVASASKETPATAVTTSLLIAAQNLKVCLIPAAAGDHQIRVGDVVLLFSPRNHKRAPLPPAAIPRAVKAVLDPPFSLTETEVPTVETSAPRS
jgi:hypothetical protein